MSPLVSDLQWPSTSPRAAIRPIEIVFQRCGAVAGALARLASPCLRPFGMESRSTLCAMAVATCMGDGCCEVPNGGQVCLVLSMAVRAPLPRVGCVWVCPGPGLYTGAARVDTFVGVIASPGGIVRTVSKLVVRSRFRREGARSPPPFRYCSVPSPGVDPIPGASLLPVSDAVSADLDPQLRQWRLSNVLTGESVVLQYRGGATLRSYSMTRALLAWRRRQTGLPWSTRSCTCGSWTQRLASLG